MELAAISTDNTTDAFQMAALVGAEFPVLADAQKTVVQAYGVFDLLGDGVSAPAAFIVGSDGEMKWRFVGRTIQDRPAPDEILRQLEALN